MASNFKSLKAKEFLPMLSDRQARFNAAKAELVEISDNATALAKALHPKRQYLKIEKVTERGEDCRSFTLVPDTEKGTTSLAYFGAGKYLTVFETIVGMPITRAYSISSSPKVSMSLKSSLLKAVLCQSLSLIHGKRAEALRFQHLQVILNIRS